MKVCAFLILRRNSQRVVGKNFRRLGQKPLYRWILDALVQVPSVDCVVIDTDARDELDKHGLPEGNVRIIDRDPALCGRDVVANDLIGHNLAGLGPHVLMTHATCPLLSAATMEQAIQRYAAALRAGQGDSLFGVTRRQTRFWRADGTAVNHDPSRLVPTQDLEPWYEENSTIYLFGADVFARTGSRIGDRPVLFEVSHAESVDIDTEADWALTEALVHGIGDR